MFNVPTLRAEKTELSRRIGFQHITNGIGWRQRAAKKSAARNAISRARSSPVSFHSATAESENKNPRSWSCHSGCSSTR